MKKCKIIVGFNLTNGIWGDIGDCGTGVGLSIDLTCEGRHDGELDAVTEIVGGVNRVEIGLLRMFDFVYVSKRRRQIDGD